MKYSDAQIHNAIAISSNWREVIERLNPDNKGYAGSQSYMKIRAQKIGANFSHFKGASWSLGKALPPQRPITDYLDGKMRIHSNLLKRKLVKEGLKKQICESCGLSIWLNKPIHLELHHKDQNHKNNALSNLEILCSNCHSFRHEKMGVEVSELSKKRANVERLRKSRTLLRPDSIKCAGCEKFLLIKQNKYCSLKCRARTARRVERPTRDELLMLISSIPLKKIAEKYNLTDNAIRKWCKKENINFVEISPFSQKKKFVID